MEHTIALRRLGGGLLAFGGGGFLLAGVLHPQGDSQRFGEAMAKTLANPFWPVAHWLALASTLALIWALWLLIDSGGTRDSPVGQAGVRLTLLAGPTVQAASPFRQVAAVSARSSTSMAQALSTSR